MKIEEILHCSFTTWYPKFRKLTIKSKTIPLPQPFLDYLNADGVVLPEGSLGATADSNQNEDNVEGEELDVIWDSDAPGMQCPEFPELDAAVKNCINSLGGVVFPKLNWSAPRDASWISYDKTLKCKCPSDIYLLLKSSEFISHDLTQPFTLCEDVDNESNIPNISYHLVLRKWMSLNPGYEFRCFVKDHDLVAISQRNHTAYYDFIGKERDDIILDIQDFYEEHIHLNFPSQNYVFDVYRQGQGDILLLDFNPFGEVTDGLLFEWEELEGNETLQGTQSESMKVPAFRYVARSEGVQPDPLLSQFGVPRDILDLASGTDPSKLIDLLQLRQSQQADESSSDEENDAHDSNRQSELT